jgi:putative effector of murein hydrolase
VHFLLGPATVALAIPLYTSFRRVQGDAAAGAVGLLAGSV